MTYQPIAEHGLAAGLETAALVPVVWTTEPSRDGPLDAPHRLFVPRI